MPQVTITDVAQRVPASSRDSSGRRISLNYLTIQNLGSNPCEFAPRSNVTYGGANGGLRLAAGAPGGDANRAKLDDGVYVICASGLTTILAYEEF